MQCSFPQWACSHIFIAIFTDCSNNLMQRQAGHNEAIAFFRVQPAVDVRLLHEEAERAQLGFTCGGLELESGAEEGLGAARATGAAASSRRPADEDGEVRCRLRQTTAVAARSSCSSAALAVRRSSASAHSATRNTAGAGM